MEFLNTVASICSIFGFLISIFVVKQVSSIRSEIGTSKQNGTGNILNNQSILGNRNNVSGRDINVGQNNGKRQW